MKIRGVAQAKIIVFLEQYDKKKKKKDSIVKKDMISIQYK